MRLGVSGGSAERSGSERRIAEMLSETVSPENGCRPVRHSYSTDANEKMSVRLSSGFPRACSGLM